MADETKYVATSPFEDSIEKFSHLDVKGNVNIEKRAIIPGLILRCLMIAMCIGVFGYAVFMLAMNAIEDDELNELYESIRAENMTSVLKPASPLLEPAPMYTFQEMLNSGGEYNNYVGDVNSMDDLGRRSSLYKTFLAQKDKYPDTYAWIYVNHTSIDYPVMKGPYTNYYLYKNFKQEDSKAGSIVAESSLSNDYTVNLNNVIYGHCMKNGEMFRTLKTFMESANRNTLAKTMNIEIYTEKGLYIYKVLSGYRDDGNNFARTTFSNTDDYAKFLKEITNKNSLGVSHSYNTDSRLVTLITCTNSSNEDERYVVHGILTSFIPGSSL